MIVEQTENKGRPEQLVIPPDWQIKPVQPPSESSFKQVGLISSEQVENALKLTPRQRRIGVISVPSNADLNLHSTLPRDIICRAPPLIVEKAEWRIRPPRSVETLIIARESQIVWTRVDKPYFCQGVSENQRIIENNLLPGSFVARLLIVAKDIDRIKFLCRKRGGEASLYQGLLEIPGGAFRSD